MTVEQRSDDLRDQFLIGMRVLAVDDDSTCLLLLETLLRQCQYYGWFLILVFGFVFKFMIWVLSFLNLYIYILDSKQNFDLHLGSFIINHVIMFIYFSCVKFSSLYYMGFVMII